MSQSDSETSQNTQAVGSENPRAGMIATAVKFLQNPKVQSSPLDQKKSFLQKKGLTDEEIQMAIDQSGVSNITTVQAPAVPPLPHTLNPHQILPPAIPDKQLSVWNRFQNYSMVAVIVGGVVYALYSLFKKLIEPIFIRQRREMDEKLAKMEQGIAQLNTNMSANIKDIQDSISAIRSDVSEQNNNISRMANNLISYKTDSSSNGVGELQSEISSLKGLLLSSRQFPAAPVNPPVIPSWQLKQEVTSSHHHNGMTSSNDDDDDVMMTNGGGDALHSGSHETGCDRRRDLEESGDEDEQQHDALNNSNGDHNGVETDVLTPSATHVLSV